MDVWETYRGWKITGEEVTAGNYRIKADDPTSRVNGVGFICDEDSLETKLDEIKSEIDNWISKLEQQ